MIGHSLGSSVVLETAVKYPKTIKSLIIMNGTYGNIFKQVF